MRVGLVVVATGKYVQFLRDLKVSVDEFFCVGHEVSMWALTDEGPGGVRSYLRWPTKHEPWPGPTLHRYRMIVDWERQRPWKRLFDYVFMCDADMRFVAPVGDEIFGDLVGTIHPGFWNKPRSQYTYEHRPESTACIPPGAGERYYAGGFQGGYAPRFLEAAKTIVDRIDSDKANGIIAVWHDESHWNRYLFEHPPTVELDPGYCYPESWSLPFEKRLLALNKDHAAMRS